MNALDPTFARLLEPFAVAELEASANTIVAVDAGGCIRYVNPAWFAFAEANGGMPAIGRRWSVGAVWLEAVPRMLVRFYRGLLHAALTRSTAAREPLRHVYECSSAAVYRAFEMTLLPLGRREGVLMTHALRVERRHDEAERPVVEVGPAADAAYRQADGLIHQCIYCRRTRAAEVKRWDWVPGWVQKMPAGVSHTLCGVCDQYYFRSVGLDPSGYEGRGR